MVYAIAHLDEIAEFEDVVTIGPFDTTLASRRSE